MQVENNTMQFYMASADTTEPLNTYSLKEDSNVAN